MFNEASELDLRNADDFMRAMAATAYVLARRSRTLNHTARDICDMVEAWQQMDGFPHADFSQVVGCVEVAITSVVPGYLTSPASNA
jgi:hypothetical protein